MAWEFQPLLPGAAALGNTPPTVALNSPADTGTVNDTTPSLDFTGTDANGDDIRFEVQVDTANTFDSQNGSEATIDSYPISNGEINWVGLPGDASQVGQSFEAPGTFDLTSVRFGLVRAYGSEGGTCVAKLYAHTGTFGTTGVPTGSALATSDTVALSSIPSLGGGWEGALATWLASATESSCTLFTFSTPYECQDGVQYCIVVEYTVDNYLLILTDYSTPTHAGNVVQYTGSWSAVNDDAIFYLYGENKIPLIDKVSGTDTGFANPDAILSDNFDDNSIDYAKWYSYSDSGGTVAETGQKIVITPPNSATGYTQLATQNQYNLVGSSVQVKVPQLADGASCDTLLILPNADFSQAYYIKSNGTNIYAGTLAGGNLASAAWNPSTMLYWRMRESGGTFYFEYSGDGVSWTTLHSMSVGSAVTSSWVVLEVDENISDATPGAAWFDDFSINDVDPFTSGENIQYTVQSALPDGTYYWRVRGIDPNGSNAYGSWSSTRSFIVSSATPSNSGRSAKVTGKSTSSSSRSAKVIGKSSFYSSRGAKITGSSSTPENASRSAKITGKTSVTASRSAKLTGKDTLTGSRPAKIIGKSYSASSRPAKVTGQDTANANRSAKVRGGSSESSYRSSKVSGIDISSALRLAKVTGKSTASSSRGAKVIGQDTLVSSRGAKVSGVATSNASRPAKITGVETDSSSRDAKTAGSEDADSYRGAETTGEAVGSDSRAGKVSGNDSSSSERDAKVSGVLSEGSSRSAKITGSIPSDDSRGASVSGKAVGSSSRGAEVSGVLSDGSYREAKTSGKEGVTASRGAVVSGAGRYPYVEKPASPYDQRIPPFGKKTAPYGRKDGPYSGKGSPYHSIPKDDIL